MFLLLNILLRDWLWPFKTISIVCYNIFFYILSFCCSFWVLGHNIKCILNLLNLYIYPLYSINTMLLECRLYASSIQDLNYYGKFAIYIYIYTNIWQDTCLCQLLMMNSVNWKKKNNFNVIDIHLCDNLYLVKIGQSGTLWPKVSATYRYDMMCDNFGSNGNPF